MEENTNQNDRIQLPPGWGPVVFLAVVILLSNAGLGLWMSSMVTTTPPRPPTAPDPASAALLATDGAGPAGAQGGPGKVPGQGGQGGPGKVPGQGGQGGPGKVPGQGGPGMQGAAAAQGGAAVSTWVVDESEFTDELEARLRTVAQEHGMDLDKLPAARQIYEQMQRSNLLPRNQDLDLETVLTGHIIEMSRQPAGAPGAPSGLEGGAGVPPAPGGVATPGGPGAGRPPAPQGAPSE